MIVTSSFADVSLSTWGSLCFMVVNVNDHACHTRRCQRRRAYMCRSHPHAQTTWESLEVCCYLAAVAHSSGHLYRVDRPLSSDTENSKSRALHT